MYRKDSMMGLTSLTPSQVNFKMHVHATQTDINALNPTDIAVDDLVAGGGDLTAFRRSLTKLTL